MPPIKHERITKPGGNLWVFNPRYSRSVYLESSPEGPRVVVIRTHDMAKARSMAELRFRTNFGTEVPQEGTREWRRKAVGGRMGSAPSTCNMRTEFCHADDPRSFPVVVFRPVVEGRLVPVLGDASSGDTRLSDASA